MTRHHYTNNMVVAKQLTYTQYLQNMNILYICQPNNRIERKYIILYISNFFITNLFLYYHTKALIIQQKEVSDLHKFHLVQKYKISLTCDQQTIFKRSWYSISHKFFFVLYYCGYTDNILIDSYDSLIHCPNDSPTCNVAIAYTETEMSSFWRNFHHWLHRKLSKWQLSVQSVIKISSKWQHFRFSVAAPPNVEQHAFQLTDCTRCTRILQTEKMSHLRYM